MVSNKLKLNKDKTKLLVTGLQHRVRPSIEGITVAGEYINASNTAETLE